MTQANIPTVSEIITALGGSAGIAGTICTLVGATPSTTVGKAIEAVVSGGLVLVSSIFAHHVTASGAKARAVVKATTTRP